MISEVGSEVKAAISCSEFTLAHVSIAIGFTSDYAVAGLGGCLMLVLGVHVCLSGCLHVCSCAC